MTYRQILVTEELHRRVKVAAAAQGKKIIEFVEEALNKRLEQSADKSTDANTDTAAETGDVDGEKRERDERDDGQVTEYDAEIGGYVTH